ncbi:hypothetical protein [Rhabdochlamydiaceae symbiont of Dictyostelium giganteum]|uniref:hypothetical protein n=1 Tax=Rhabdochlamydiaceae symbiont of Dictyostelium giganteum TaxID=3342349 RepID=UPI00384A56FD
MSTSLILSSATTTLYYFNQLKYSETLFDACFLQTPSVADADEDELLNQEIEIVSHVLNPQEIFHTLQMKEILKVSTLSKILIPTLIGALGTYLKLYSPQRSYVFNGIIGLITAYTLFNIRLTLIKCALMWNFYHLRQSLYHLNQSSPQLQEDIQNPQAAFATPLPYIFANIAFNHPIFVTALIDSALNDAKDTLSFSAEIYNQEQLLISEEDPIKEIE